MPHTWTKNKDVVSIRPSKSANDFSFCELDLYADNNAHI